MSFIEWEDVGTGLLAGGQGGFKSAQEQYAREGVADIAEAAAVADAARKEALMVKKQGLMDKSFETQHKFDEIGFIKQDDGTYRKVSRAELLRNPELAKELKTSAQLQLEQQGYQFGKKLEQDEDKLAAQIDQWDSVNELKVDELSQNQTQFNEKINQSNMDRFIKAFTARKQAEFNDAKVKLSKGELKLNQAKLELLKQPEKAREIAWLTEGLGFDSQTAINLSYGITKAQASKAKTATGLKMVDYIKAVGTEKKLLTDQGIDEVDEADFLGRHPNATREDYLNNKAMLNVTQRISSMTPATKEEKAAATTRRTANITALKAEADPLATAQELYTNARTDAQRREVLAVIKEAGIAFTPAAPASTVSPTYLPDYGGDIKDMTRWRLGQVLDARKAGKNPTPFTPVQNDALDQLQKEYDSGSTSMLGN